MSEFIRSGEVKKTRKLHRCHGCREVIPVKSKAYTNTSTYDGSISTTYMCKACNDYEEKKCSNCKDCYDDGFYEGFINDCMAERK